MAKFNIGLDKNVTFATRVIVRVEADNCFEAKKIAEEWGKKNADLVKKAQEDGQHIINPMNGKTSWIPNADEGAFFAGVDQEPEAADFVVEDKPKEKKYNIILFDNTGKCFNNWSAPGTKSYSWSRIPMGSLSSIILRLTTMAKSSGGSISPYITQPSVFLLLHGNEASECAKSSARDAMKNPDDVVFMSFEVKYPDDVR